jgi:hypothetical protein
MKGLAEEVARPFFVAEAPGRTAMAPKLQPMNLFHHHRTSGRPASEQQTAAAQNCVPTRSIKTFWVKEPPAKVELR